MGLVNLTTDLKSLKFGHDRLDGGDSGQPYIKNPILSKPSQLSQGSDDFLLRGGLKAPLDALTDVARLTKWFFDFKNPKGLLFTAKQNLLSRTSVATQASGNDSVRDSWKNATLNEGVYTPLSTLAQAGIGFIGGHVDKQGLIPFIKGVTTYLDRINNIIGENDGSINRLFELYTDKIEEIPGKDNGTNPTLIQSYNGGPGSDLGIGKTSISFAQNQKGSPLRTGVNNLWANPKSPNISFPFQGNGESWQTTNQKSHQIEDFREPYLKDQTSSTIMSIAPDYKNPTKTIDGSDGSRINFTSPGKRGNIFSYTDGKTDIQGKSYGAIDKINALPIYKTTGGLPDIKKPINDLIPFYISVLNPTTPKTQEYIHFRAYISGFSDSYSSTWNESRYMGRAESFWKYGGFGRSISMGFKVVAHSREELIPMYKKLNFLASTLAPTYSSEGYMGGTLLTLTVGGYLYKQTGFLNGLTLTIPDDSPWEIGIDDEGNNITEGKEKIKQLSHIIDVSGFSFTPIEDFRVEKQTIEDGVYGQQRFISLENGGGDSYTKENIKDNG